MSLRSEWLVRVPQVQDRDGGFCGFALTEFALQRDLPHQEVQQIIDALTHDGERVS